MKKTLSRLLYSVMFISFLSFSLVSCKSKIKDQDIEAKIQANSALSHVAASVKEGVVTLSGEPKMKPTKPVPKLL